MTIEHAASIANVVSAVAAMVSAAIAWRAMAQAMKAATFAPKSEAIGYLHAAVAALNEGNPYKDEAVQNAKKAEMLAARVFSNGVKNALRRQVQAVENVHPDAHDWGKPIEDLKALIDRMNREAYLGE